MIYGDYNRTIVGFHGTSRAKSLLLVQRKADFEASHNRDDWLGHGIYFWEHAPRQAYAWAQQRWGDDAAVVASMIRLGNCFDLLDPPNT